MEAFMNKYYIGFDAGTQSVKVAIYSLTMECVAEKTYPTTLFIHILVGWR